ncbi:MAG: hypothetical protein ABUT20_06045, partial [Bacteroidota bacterium]
KNNSLKIGPSKKQNPNWKGEWERDLWQNPASLKIKNIISDSLDFQLFSSSGGHSGEIEGKALINGNIATYYLAEKYDTCLLSFEIFGDSLIVMNHTKGNCFAAMGVTYAGKYYNSKTKSKKILSEKENSNETLLTLGIFDNPSEDSAFRLLTNEDYNLFLSSTQLSSDDDDLDNFNAKVKSSAVRGLFTIMENIIIIDSSKNIWAAVIDEDKVLYYTNNKDYQIKLPKTIENWRSGFKNYPVVYKSKN